MAIKVENTATIPVKALEEQVQRAVSCVPVEHLRGFSRVVFVDKITDPRVAKDLADKLPALYHPRVPGTPSAYGEIALAILLPSNVSWLKKLAAKAQTKALIAQTVLTLLAQHYLVTVSSRRRHPDRKGCSRIRREVLQDLARQPGRHSCKALQAARSVPREVAEDGPEVLRRAGPQEGRRLSIFATIRCKASQRTSYRYSKTGWARLPPRATAPCGLRPGS